MLQITIPAAEFFDESSDQFIQTKETVLTLEHSLLSLSKWESKWNKAFLSKEDKSFEETIDYIKCMTLTKNVDPNLYLGLTKKNIEEINAYIAAPMTATHINKREHKINRETTTSELLYYWMISLGIPFECQKWHLNRLITLIEVCSIKSQPAKKMSKGAIMRQNAALNAARRKKLNTTG